MHLQGKIALVTGGSKGIGKGIAYALAEAGSNVVFTYHSNRDMAEKIIQNMLIKNKNIFTVHMETEKRNSVTKALSAIKDKWGSVDILINNAAISQEKPFEAITDSDWDKMLAVNLKGPFICAQEVLPQMVEKKWGRIINISSIGGQWGGFNQVHYAAAKAGLINLTRSLARIYSKNGITTNAIAPGLVNTDMASNEINSDSGLEKVKNIPIGRIATVEEVAQAVVFLASDEARYITGQTINVNGGMYFG